MSHLEGTERKSVKKEKKERGKEKEPGKEDRAATT